MDDMELVRVDYAHAPSSVRRGRVIMLVGCGLFFFSAALNLLSFSLNVFAPNLTGASWDWSTQEGFSASFRLLMDLPLGLLLLAAGIGGLAFAVDRGGKLRKWGTLAAIVTLVVFVIDTVLTIRTLVHELVGRAKKADGTPYETWECWVRFFINLIDLQLSGGVFLLGWWKVKDYVGDAHPHIKKKPEEAR